MNNFYKPFLHIILVTILIMGSKISLPRLQRFRDKRRIWRNAGSDCTGFTDTNTACTVAGADRSDRDERCKTQERS